MILLEKQRESINSTSPSTSTSTIIEEEFTQSEDDLSKCVIFYLFIFTKKTVIYLNFNYLLLFSLYYSSLFQSILPTQKKN